MTEPPVSKRWSPWWAIALTVIALIPPGMVLVAGLEQLSLARSGGYMGELAAVVAPILLAVGAMAAVPGVLYLVVRRRFAFVCAVVVAIAILVATLA